jgi:hypothetical protein
MRDRVELEAQLMTLTEILKDLEESLWHLTDPDYDPELDPDGEFRDGDIENLELQIAEIQREKCLVVLRLYDGS